MEKTLWSSLGISLSVSSHLRSSYCRCTTAKSVFIFLALHITEDPLKYSPVMYHCAPLFQHILHTLSVPPLSIACSLSIASKVLYNDDDSSRRPGSVFAISMQNRTVYTYCNRTSCRVGTMSRSQKASATTKDVALSPPEDAAPSHCCEEVASFFFLICIDIYFFVCLFVSCQERK